MNSINLYINYFYPYLKNKSELKLTISQAELLQQLNSKTNNVHFNFFVDIYDLPIILNYLKNYTVTIIYICPESIDACFKVAKDLNMDFNYDHFFQEYINTINILNLFIVNNYTCKWNLFTNDAADFSTMTIIEIDNLFKPQLTHKNGNVININDLHVLRYSFE